MPILYLALTSPTMPLYQLDEYGENMMAQRISMVPGVAQVVVFGAQKFAVRVQVDPNKLNSYGLGLDEVAMAIAANNVNLPTGTLYGNYQAYAVLASGQLYHAADYAPMIVAYRNGSPVRLNQIGRAIDSVENDKTAAWYNGERSVILAILRQPGTNTVAVAQQVKDLMPQFRADLPASVNLNTIYDRSLSIKNSYHDVNFTLLLTLVLVVLVIFLFLRNFSATLIPSITLPITIVATFAAMYFMNYSLDNLSLMALTLSVGFVADDAIVMLENIVRHIERGEKPLEAALKGSREISFTILSMTLSLAAIFIPVIFMPGIVGRLLREFSMTIAFAILISGVVSLTLTPMMCGRMLRHQKQHGRLFQASERVFSGMLAAYEWALRIVLRHSFITVVFAVATVAATVYMFSISPTDFFPADDTNQVFGFTECAQGISYDDMVRHQKAVAAIIAADPNIDAFMSSAGGRGGIGSANTGVVFMRLKPRGAGREIGVDEVIQGLRKKLGRVPGIDVRLQNPPLIRTSGQLTQALYQYTLLGPDTTELYKRAGELEAKLKTMPDLQDVTSDLRMQNPQMEIWIDRDKASSLGLTAQQIETALFSAFSFRQVSTIYAPSNEYQVILETLPENQRNPSDLSAIYVRSSTGALVPLDTVARITRDVGPLTVNHTGQLPSVTISFNLTPGVPLGTAVEEIEKIVRGTMPATITANFVGAAQAFQKSMGGMIWLLVLAVGVIYIVLGCLYESFWHPITILSGLPSAAVGALLTLLIFGYPLSLYAFVGIIMLIGIVKKNAIMMIDFALAAQRKEGKSPAEAIYQGCVIRFRPIMMTTMAALMAGLPIAVGFGSGAASRRPLGLAVVGGLVFSQLITLFITPVIFLQMERWSRWVSAAMRPRAAEQENS
jgi:HAE1 family hydrophobic/amphiphilic exporter-1